MLKLSKLIPLLQLKIFLQAQKTTLLSRFKEDDEDETEESNSWYEDDPTWNPEKIDSDYQQIKDEDDSEKTHDNPRY